MRIVLDEKSTVETLLLKLARELPDLNRFMATADDLSHNFAVTRDRELLQPNSVLKDGDELKIFGPISGGL